MRILACGDLHLRLTTPAMRKDDFVAEMKRKLHFIIQLAIKKEADAVVFPGDVFDRHDASYGLVEYAITMFRQLSAKKIAIFVVAGQHDMRYHSRNLLNTPLGVVCAGVPTMVLLYEQCFNFGINFTPPRLCGLSWGSELPTFVKGSSPDILVMHRPIVNKPVPWEHPDMLTTKELAAKFPEVKIFITGDNHTSFDVVSNKDQLILNMGSVMRTSIDQVKHKPRVTLIDFDGSTYEYWCVNIPVEKDVFDLAKVETAQELQDKVDAFMDGLSVEFDPALDFKENLRIASKEAPDGVKNILQGVLS